MPIEPRKQHSIFSFLTLILLGRSLSAASERCMSRRIDLVGRPSRSHELFPDANVFGTLATPADAYRFAKGGPLTRADGTTVARPLDFVAVTEHASGWTSPQLRRSGRVLLQTAEPVVKPFTRERLTTQGVRSHNNNGTYAKPLALCDDKCAMY